MATRNPTKKTPKKTEKKAGESVKCTLPAFGIAEEILGTAGLASEIQSPELEARNAESEAWGQSSDGRSKERDLKFDDDEHHLVTFNLDREEYGVEIGSVQEIIRVGQITPVPKAPKYITGVINLRGRVIPVVNLRKRLDLPDGALTKDSRIMVVESGRKILGMLVDCVFHVLKIPSASVDDPPSEMDQRKAYICGIGKVDARLIMIMDLNRALEKDATPGEAAAHQPLPERISR